MNDKIINFKKSEEYKEFENYYTRPNVMDLLGMFRYEDAHTNFLCSLLNKNNPYNLKTYPLKKLLELIYSKDKNKVSKNVLSLNCNITEFEEIKRGKSIGKDAEGELKPDIIIRFKLNGESYTIVVECKLFSNESENQCKRYSTFIENNTNYNNDKKIYLFLSLNEENITSDDTNFIHITYQDLINMIYEPCSHETKESLMLSIDEYMRSFNALYEISGIKLEEYPITPKGKELTLNLWNKYKNEIQEIIENFNSNKKLYNSNEHNEHIFKILFINLYNLIEDNNSKDKIFKLLVPSKRFKINNNYYSNSEFMCEMMRILINDHKEWVNIEDIPQEILKTTTNWENVITKDAYENHYRKDYYTKNNRKPLEINNTTLYYVRPNDNDIRNLIEAINKKYPNKYNLE